ncbi:AtpZ/AtpI family protein [Trinickia symbiotica]
MTCARDTATHAVFEAGQGRPEPRSSGTFGAAAMTDDQRSRAKRAFDDLEAAARRASKRHERGERDPEPSIGSRLAQIGILGWTIVVPTLAGLALGRWLDRVSGNRILFSAPLLMIGAALGFWFAWKWMHRQQQNDHD